MIDTTQLRPGNVMWKDRSIDDLYRKQIDSVDIFEIDLENRMEEGGELYTRTLTPIKLTRDEAKRLGFKKHDKFEEMYIQLQTATGPITVELNVDDESLFIGDQEDPNYAVITVEYMHELQNALWVLNNFKDVEYEMG